MLHDILMFVPLMVCLFWMVLHIVLSFRTTSFSIVLLLLAVAGLFFMIDGYNSSIHGTPGMQIWFSILYQLVAPSLIPVSVLYMVRLQSTDRFSALQFLWVLIPVGMFSATALVTSIIGVEELSSFLAVVNRNGLAELSLYKGEPVYSYYVWSNLILRVIIAFEMLYMILYLAALYRKKGWKIATLWDFFAHDGRAEVLQLQTIPMMCICIVYLVKLVLFKDYLDTHLTMTAILSIIVAFSVFYFALTAMFGAKESLTREEMRNGMRYNYNRQNKQLVVEEMIGELIDDAEAEALKRIRSKIGVSPELEAWEKGEKSGEEEKSIASAIFSAVAESWDEDSLMGRFQKVMLEERLYLKPGLSLGDVAERLGSNKTYISKMVNNTYNLGFPELLNILRIDYAEHYIMLHKNAKQDEIAEACGFFSASSFNNTFKKITGMTPKVWVASQEKRRV